MTQELYKEINQLRDENIRLLKTALELNRALRKAKKVLDEIEEKYRNNGWFEKLKEMEY
jgi:hypothetical protein